MKTESRKFRNNIFQNEMIQPWGQSKDISTILYAKDTFEFMLIRITCWDILTNHKKYYPKTLSILHFSFLFKHTNIGTCGYQNIYAPHKKIKFLRDGERKVSIIKNKKQLVYGSEKQ